jgi:prepilin-type N-terminal cleavage/methylation domain-containing protein
VKHPLRRFAPSPSLASREGDAICGPAKPVPRWHGSAPSMNQRGFTLIELLVVVVILGVMLAMVMPDTRSAAAVQR